MTKAPLGGFLADGDLEPLRTRTTPRRRRSLDVRLGLALAVSAHLVACERDHRRCVNQDNLVMDEERCNRPGYWGSGYHWYYGGRGFQPGEFARRGSELAPHSSGVERGGFGAHGEGFGEHGEGFGGHGEGGGHS